MANVNIRFNGKEFLLSCDDGQEEHLEELAEHFNTKFLNLKSELGNIGENKLLLIASIKVMDEYFETKKKIEEKKEELKTKIDIEEIEDEYDCLKWRYPDGRIGKPTPWSGFPQRLKRIRDRRKK